MPRIAIAGFAHETNSFAPTATAPAASLTFTRLREGMRRFGKGPAFTPPG